MSPIGHAGIALIVYGLYRVLLEQQGYDRYPYIGLVLTLVFTRIPDYDTRIAEIPHRGITHTIWFALLLGLIAAYCIPLLREKDIRFNAILFGYGALPVLAHLAGDIITPMGLTPLTPLSEVHYTFNLVSAHNTPANATFLVAGILTLVSVIHRYNRE